MKTMTKKNKTLTLTAITLTIVLVGVVLFGVGAFRKSNGVSGAGATSTEFTIPTSTGEIGTATNPYVVLEIVPSEDMAQFGYLVQDQEPIDMVSLPESERTAVENLVKTELAVSTANNGTPFKAGFASEPEVKEEKEKYSWAASPSTQFGEYIYHEEGGQDYDLVLDKGETTDGGKVFVNDDDVQSYAYVATTDPNAVGTLDITTATVPYDEVGISVFPKEEDDPTLYDADHNLKILAGDTYIPAMYVKREPGTGIMSDEKYTLVASDSAMTISGGEYSMQYKKVDEGGNYSFGPVTSEGTGAGSGSGEGTVEIPGASYTYFKLMANGYFMDMGNEENANRLDTTNVSEASTDQYFRVEALTGNANKVDGKTGYIIWTGKSGYTQVLTAQLDGGSQEGYVVSKNPTVTNGTYNSQQRFAIVDEGEYKRIYYRSTGAGAKNYYFTGKNAAGDIKLVSDKYTAEDTTETISTYLIAGGTSEHQVYAVKKGNAGEDAKKYYLYTKGSGYLQAITHNGETTSLTYNPQNSAEFKMTDDGKHFYAEYDGKKWYLYVKNGEFAMYTPQSGPGEVTTREVSDRYALISNKWSNKTYSHLVKLVFAGTEDINGETRDLYYVYKETNGFSKDDAICYKNGTFSITSNPASESDSKFYYSDDKKLVLASRDSTYLYVKNDGDYGFASQKSYAGTVTFPNDDELKKYYIVAYNTFFGVVSVEGKKVYSSRGGFSDDLANNKASWDGSTKIRYKSSSKYYYLYCDNNGPKFSDYSGSSYAGTLSSLPALTSRTLATITNGTVKATVKIEKVGSSGSNYYIYDGINFDHQVACDTNGNIIQKNSSPNSNAYTFELVTEGTKKYFKVKLSGAKKPYLYAYSKNEVRMTAADFTIPGEISAGTDTRIRSDYKGLQLFTMVDEQTTLIGYIRYILNDGASAPSGTKVNRYLEVNNVTENGKLVLVQNKTDIDYSNDNQKFAFVETEENSGLFYIYTGHSNYTKVLTLESYSTNCNIVEDVLNPSQKEYQTFSLSLETGAGSIMNTSDYQRIRTRYEADGALTSWSINGPSTAANAHIHMYYDHKDSASFGNRKNYPERYNQYFKLIDASSAGSKTLGFYEDADGDYELLVNPKFPMNVGTYTYKNETGSAQTISIYGTDIEYTVAAHGELKLYLGDYNREELDKPEYIEEKEDHSQYGNKNYKKYILQLVTGGYKYAFTMAKLTGENAGNGYYEWSGYSYEECYGSSKKVHNTAEYAKVVVYTGLEGGTDISDDVRKEYQVIKSNQSQDVITLYQAGTATKSADSFKKYALGLAYIGGDYSKGLADESYTFGGWYTDPNCMYKFSADTVLTRDITLYARWICDKPVEADVKVYFDCNAYKMSEYDEDGNPTPEAVVLEDEDGEPIPEDGMAMSTMPATIEAVRKGNKITAPKATPIRSGYIFAGWFDDPDCVWDNAAEREVSHKIVHNFYEPVNSALTLYAGWIKLSTTDVYTLKFNANTSYVSMPTGIVENLPSTVDNYAANGRLRTVDMDGNYVYSDITLSPGFCEEVDGVMTPLTPVLKTGTGAESQYVFDGWYYYATCDEDSYRFDFNTTVSDSVPKVVTTDEEGTKRTITLYAKWVKKSTKCTVSFNTNIPAGSPEAKNVPSPITVEYGSAVGQEAYKNLVTDLATMRDSDVDQLVKNYHVKVITVTPKDLNDSANNRKLIDRANLIVINQSCSDDMRNLWQAHRNTVLFAKDEAYYNASTALAAPGTAGKVETFIQNDLNWDSTEAILKKVAGVGTQACPIVYDYTAYTGALNDSSAKNVKTTTNFSDVAGTEHEAKGSKNNVYKLYLMTQQMNPITLYNAYINDTGAEDGKQEITKSGNTAVFKNEGFTVANISGLSGDDKYTYWSKNTLVPYGAMTKGDYALDTMSVLAVAESPEIANSSLDASKQKRALIKNRVLVFNGGKDSETLKITNIVSAFETLTYESIGEDDLNSFMCPGAVAPTSYKTSEALYYMINNTGMYTNFTKNLRVLEIEAGDAWKDQSYWFWYVSRYVPNYTGKSERVKRSTLALVGDIDDLNAAFDIIYFGVNTDTNLESYTKKVMPGTMTGETVGKDAKITLKVGQTITVPFFRPYDDSTTVIDAVTVKDTLEAGVDGFERVNTVPRAVQFSVEGTTCTASLFTPNIGALKSTYGLQVVATPSATRPAGTDCYYYLYYTEDEPDEPKRAYFTDVYINSTGKTENGADIDQTEHAISSSWNEANTMDTVDDTTIFFLAKDAEDGDGVKGYIQLDEFAAKVDSTYTQSYIWETGRADGKNAKRYDAGSFAYAGETIMLDSPGVYYVSSGNVYIYAHVGARDSSKNTRLGIFDTEREGSNDDVNLFVYSGNDITMRKYEDLIDFVKAGYPIIVSSNLLTSDHKVDTNKVDNSSYMYKFLNELSRNYTSSFFVDNDTTRDDEFVTALKNKTFDLIVLSKPTEYVDKTYKEESGNMPYKDYHEDQIYVNGASDDSRRNIDKRDLTYQIYIDSTKNGGYYKLRMYIDTNADGRFDEDEERLDTLEVTNALTGSTVNADRLLGGVYYNINRRVVEYAGILPWKLEIIDGENSLIHDYVTGQCAIKVEEKERVNVLQIVPNSGVNVYLPTDGEYTEAKKNSGGKDIADYDISKSGDVASIEKYFNRVIRTTNSTTGRVSDTTLVKNAGWFYYYTAKLNEFDVHFYRMSVTEFVNLVKTGKAPNGVNENESGNVYLDDGYCTYFDTKDINMLILGYADCFTDIESDAACAYIEDFIAAGNTTLFTHDTTSFVNKKDKTGFNGYSDIWWGYYINKYFRDILGMDRFGVMTNRGAEDPDAPDWPFKFNTNQTQYETADSTKLHKKVLLNQGLTNVCVGQDGSRINYAKKTNDGQIVDYPYRIPDTLEVATTHSQYYQLDMEADDIVVWYCLTDTRTDSRGKYSYEYYATENDVRNNYYIYNRGNITYSGVGHASNMKENEYKLFVNTMIAAYQASSLATEPVITNRDRSVDSGMDYLYVDYDATLSGAEAQPFGEEISGWTVSSTTPVTLTTPAAGVDPDCFTKEVHFTLKNYSIILNKRMTIHYYPVVYDRLGNRVVLEDCPLDLPTMEYDDINEEWKPTSTIHMVQTAHQEVDSSGKRKDFVIERVITDSDDHTYNNASIPKFKTDVETLSGGGKKYTYTSKITGSEVDSLKQYYVAVPISDVYYQMLQSPMYQSIMKDKDASWQDATNISNFALDTNNHFEIEIRVVMRYGRDPNKCDPLVGTRGAVFMRRGMFTLD